jgi:hypothetical protein
MHATKPTVPRSNLLPNERRRGCSMAVCDTSNLRCFQQFLRMAARWCLQRTWSNFWLELERRVRERRVSNFRLRPHIASLVVWPPLLLNHKFVVSSRSFRTTNSFKSDSLINTTPRLFTTLHCCHWKSLFQHPLLQSVAQCPFPLSQNRTWTTLLW